MIVHSIPNVYLFFLECDCDPEGTVDDGDCDMFTDEFEGTSAGQCHCKENVGGVRCDGCKNGYWNFTLENELGCQGKSHLIFNNTSSSDYTSNLEITDPVFCTEMIMFIKFTFLIKKQTVLSGFLSIFILKQK